MEVRWGAAEAGAVVNRFHPGEIGLVGLGFGEWIFVFPGQAGAGIGGGWN